MVLIDKMREKVEGVKAVLRLFERSVLIFPVAVTTLVGVALLGGGDISPWQWWLPVCGVLLLTLLTRRETLSRRVYACALFLLLLGFIWVYSGLFVSTRYYDYRAYHLPAIRLLIEGWNPVMVNTREALAQVMNVNLREMNSWHVLFMARGTWFFNAAAYTFTHDPFGLIFPLFPFLFIGASGQLWRLLRPSSAWIKALCIIFLFILAPSVMFLADCVVGLAGIALLCTMTRRLHREPGILLPLFCMSFWMIVSKQTGILSCFVFWVCFSVALLFREKWTAVPYLAKMAGALLVAFCIVCASPYLTSWKHYGHPLYPAYTVDEARFPAKDITWDFRVCNDDAKAMGHVGSFFYTYISPAIGRAYYNWKLGKSDFAPNRKPWWQHAGTANPTVPITATMRWQFLIAFALVAILGGRRLLFIWCATALALFCFPTAYLGYLRYTPWLAGVQVLALYCLGCALWKFAHAKQRWRALGAGVLLVGVSALFARGAFSAVLNEALILDERQRMNAYLDSLSEPPKTLYMTQFGRDEEGATDEIGSLRLLCRMVPLLRGAEIYCLTTEEEKTLPPYFVNPEFRVPNEISEQYNDYAKIQAIPDRKARILRYPLFILKTYTVTLPKLVWRRVKGICV